MVLAHVHACDYGGRTMSYHMARLIASYIDFENAKPPYFAKFGQSPKDAQHNVGFDYEMQSSQGKGKGGKDGRGTKGTGGRVKDKLEPNGPNKNSAHVTVSSLQRDVGFALMNACRTAYDIEVPIMPFNVDMYVHPARGE